MSIAKIALLVAVVSTIHAQTAYDSLYLKSTHYRNLVGLYDLSKTEKARIVFFGNSITFGAGNWSELLGREGIVNRGIGGDNLPGMLNRLHQVYRLQPQYCFIMAGINDLYADANVDTVFARYVQLIDSLQAKKIIPVIQSTLHVNPKWKRTEEKNPLVAKLNAMLRSLALRRSLEFIDVNSVVSRNGVLRDEYTGDGVHLTPAAYAAWRELLEPLLDRLGVEKDK